MLLSLLYSLPPLPHQFNNMVGSLTMLLHAASSSSYSFRNTTFSSNKIRYIISHYRTLSLISFNYTPCCYLPSLISSHFFYFYCSSPRGFMVALFSSSIYLSVCLFEDIPFSLLKKKSISLFCACKIFPLIFLLFTS